MRSVLTSNEFTLYQNNIYPFNHVAVISYKLSATKYSEFSLYQKLQFYLKWFVTNQSIS